MEAQQAQPDTDRHGPVGNTKQPVRCRAWVFTLNNYTEEDIQKITGTECLRFVFQEEIGEQGTKHLQGFIEHKNPRTMSAMKKLLERAHWEKCNNIKASIAYCQKPETRNGRVFRKGVPAPIEDPLAGTEPYNWQREILDLIETKPDSRTIHWYWDATGNKGKTTLAKHICLKHPNAIYLSGASKDIKAGVASAVKDGHPPTICIFDLCRTNENYVSYQGIEEVKNGIFFSTKYESSMVMFNCPHVIIFANFPPDASALSADRWNIKEINNIN